MNFPFISRRHLMLASAGVAAARLASGQKLGAKLTASEVVDRIRANVGVPWRTQTVDKIIAGPLDTPVRGIATTMMATLDVLKRSSDSGRNLVVTHETPFYLHQDDTSDLVGDATLRFKLDFIREHGMAVFHFHDHWHARKPDGIATGMMRELGWTEHADPQDPRRFSFPGVPLQSLVEQMTTRLQIGTVRVVGDPRLSVWRAMASWGYVSRMPGIAQFRESGLNLFIAGETREWELVEYAQDSISKGDKKALIVLGHVVSEQGGMKYCADWLRSFIPEVPVEFIPASEPFWSPTGPRHSAI